MTAIKAKSEALQPRDLSSEELDVVSGGFISYYLRLAASKAAIEEPAGETGGQNDPAQMFQQIMQQLAQAGKRAGCG